MVAKLTYENETVFKWTVEKEWGMRYHCSWKVRENGGYKVDMQAYLFSNEKAVILTFRGAQLDSTADV